MYKAHSKNKIFARIASIMLCICFVLCCVSPVFALNQKTLRVAYYPLDGFFEYDENGNEQGYGVDLLNMISRFSGIEFTYVPAETWESTKQMLLDGKADVRMPGTLPSTPSATLDYTNHSIIDTYTAVLALNNRDDLHYDDFSNFKNIKIAISSLFYESFDDKSVLESMNITTDNLVFYEEYDDCLAALNSGEVDALISNIMDMTSDMKQIAKFDNTSNYISLLKDSPYVQLIDDALSSINMNAPTFFSDEYKKWFPTRISTPLTLEESEYVENKKALYFEYEDDLGYLSRLENGEHIGVCPSLAELLCDKLGVSCNEATSDSATTVIPYYAYDYTWADKQGVEITQPFYTVNYYELSRKGSGNYFTTGKMAAVKDFYITQNYILNHISEDNIYWCDDYAECVDAVLNGTVDFAYVNSYVAEYYLGIYRYSSLSASLIDFSNQICIGVTGENAELVVSMLDKTLSTMPQDEIYYIIMSSTSQKPKQNLLMEWMYQNPLASAAIGGFVAIGLAAIIFMAILTRRTNQKNKEILVASNTKQDFLSRMSHDMRTPMNAIIGFSSFGMHSETLEEAQNYHSKIYKSGEYLLQLINDSLDLSKLESGKYTLHPEPYHNAEFMHTLNNILQPHAKEKGVSFEITYECAAPPWVMLDKLRTEQIFVNLLNNAIKFTPRGGRVALHVICSSEDDENCTLVYKVIDTGCGMSQQFIDEKLFKPFEQEHQTEITGGTGLGLSIVKTLVDAMGGTITVESKEGKGTTFTVTLHAKLAEQQPDIDNDAPLPLTALDGKHVLLCEDHPLNREIAIRQLKNVGIITDTANDGALGVDKFKEMPDGYYDAILMDIRMPNMDGYEATQTIRALDTDYARNIPIIALSANAYEEDIAKCLEVGMNSHVAKPVDPQRLYGELLKFTL